MAFIQLTSPLILAGDPTLPNHPATKQYVDNKADNINAAGFTAGILNVMRLPALVGDVTMEAGGGTLVLTTTGVVPGTYTKITLSATGRITAGASLSADDMPALSWSKIVSGLPTTLAGYGITGVIGVAGGTITGTLSSTATPSAPLHLVTKSYVDAMIQPSGSSLATGDVVRKGYTTTPSGFLRANGSKVSKVTYSALYSIIGDRYEVLMVNGVEMPFAHQEPLGLAGYMTGTVAKETSTTNSFSSYADVLATFVTHNKLYLISSSNDGGYRHARTFYATINVDGSLSNWIYDANANFGGGANVVNENVYMSVFFTKNKVWYMYAATTGSPKLFYSDIASNGVVGQQYAASTPAGISDSTRPVVVKNRLYMIDYNFVGTSGPLEIAYSNIDANGNISGIAGLGQISASAVKGSCMDAFVYKNKLFAVLWTGSNHQVFYAAINSDATLGPWVAGPSVSGIPNGTHCRAITTTTGIYFLISTYGWFVTGEGENATSYQAYGVRTLTLNTDAAGLPVSWELSGYFGETGGAPVARRAVVVKNRVYLAFYHNSWNIGNAYVPFVGGLTTYKDYYDGTKSTPDPANFYLPDFTSKETYNTRYFIKT